MNEVLEFAKDYWWLVFPFSGTIFGGFRAIGAANARRAENRQERYRLKQQAKIATAQAQGKQRVDREAETRSMTKLLAEHAEIDARWFAYETDVINLLEFPMMTDMRDPLTVAFHRAKRGADSLRPDAADELVGDRGAQGLLRMAMNTASTPQERQSAYRKAREELDGLVSLPTVVYAQIEQRVAGELEA